MLAADTTLAVFDVLIRVLHVGAAIIAAGGVFFQWWALHPTLANCSESQRTEFRNAIVARWWPVVAAVIFVLLLSGLLNFVINKIPEYRDHASKGVYHGLFGLKFLAAMLAFHGAAVLALPGSRGERYRAKAAFWLQYLVVLFAIIITLGAILRNFELLFPRS